MPFGSPQWPCANRWPKEGRERSMREARLPSRPPTAPKTERFEAGALPMASRNSFRHPCICCRSGFRRDLCIIENRGFRVTEAAFTATLASSKTRVRGESPSYRNHLFVGAALAATLCVIKNQRFGIFGATFAATVAPSKAEVRDGSPPARSDRRRHKRVTEGVSRFCRAWPLCRTTASSCPTILGHTHNGAPWVPLPDPC
jgi:hypothetical protein